MASVARTKYLSRDQIQHLQGFMRDRAESTGWSSDVVAWMIVDVALQSGLRVGELALLTRASLDFEQRIIHAVRLKKKGGPQPCELPMSDSLHSHLREYCAWLSSQSPVVDPRACLFLGKRGPMTRRGLQQAWSKAVSRAGLPRLTIHAARHSFAVAVRQETGDIVVVQKMLGHSDPRVTANMYGNVSFEEKSQVIANVFG